MKKINFDLIKQYVMKKDNMLILILTGILFLVIAWPVGEKETSDTDMNGMWSRSGVDSGTNDEKTKQAYEKLQENGTQESTGDILEEEYMIEKLEEKLEKLLSSVQGAGKVQVMITLADRGEKIVEKDIPLERNNVVENDSTGGNRSTNEMYSQEETVYYINAEGDKIPYVIKETSASVAGVSVVAQGGDNIEVQKNISEMIQALFGIEEHKIKVVKMKQQE